MKRYLPDIAATAIILILVVAFFFPLFYPEPKLIVTPDFGRSDSWHSSIAAKAILRDFLQNGKLPLWVSFLGDGYPLFADGLVGALYLPTLLLFSTLPLVPAINLFILFCFVLGGLGFSVWLRLLHLNAIAALFGGVTYMFSGVFITQVPHLMVIPTLAMIPWIFVGTELIIRKPTLQRVGFLAFVIGEEILVGFPQSTVIGLSFALFYFVWQLGSLKDKRWRVIQFTLSLGLGVGIGLVQLLPTLEYFQQTTALGGFSPDIALYFSYPLKHLITFLAPFALGNPRHGSYPPFDEFDGSIFWENSGFIGWVPLLVILVTLMRRQYDSAGFRSVVRWSMVAGVAAALLMLGKHSPLYLLYSLPPLNIFRVPSRFLWIVVITLILVASIGFHKLWSWASKPVRCILIAIFIMHIYQILSVWQSYHALVPAEKWLEAPPVISQLSNAQKIISIGSSISFNKIFLTHGWQTIDPYYFLRNALAPNSNVLWNIRSHDVYAGRPLRRAELLNKLLASQLTVDTQRATISAQGIKLLQMIGVDRMIATLPLTHNGLSRLTSLSDLHTTITVYSIPGPCPRAYLTTDTRVAKTFSEANELFGNNTFASCKSTLVEEDFALGKGQTRGIVTVDRNEEDFLTMFVGDNTTASLLVLTDTVYPGWIATIDNQPTDIVPVNVSQRGVIVPPGDHRVTFQFRPKSFVCGAYLSVTFLSIAVALMGYPIVVFPVDTLKKVYWQIQHS